MIKGFESDVVLIALSSVSAVADRVINGANGSRRLLLAPLLFATGLLFDLVTALGTDLPHFVLATAAAIGFASYIAGGVALALAFIDHLTRGDRSGGARSVVQRLAR